MSGYVSALQQYALFRGRSTRSEFWMFAVTYAVIMLAATVLDILTGTPNEPSIVFGSIVYLSHITPYLAVFARRLHDIDRSAWWLLLIPTGVGMIALTVFASQRGTAGPNRYGDDPAAGRDDDVFPAAARQVRRLRQWIAGRRPSPRPVEAGPILSRSASGQNRMSE